jgi:hypothetical protein
VRADDGGLRDVCRKCCKSAKVANTTKMFSVSKIKLDFEVDRIMVDKLLLVDDNHQSILLAIVKDAKKMRILLNMY